MQTVQTNNNGPAANGFAELNHDIQDELKEVRNGVTGQGQGLSEEDESQINEDSGDENDRHMEEVGQAKTPDQVVKQVMRQDSQGPSVNWERFLPFQSLKVLLVENDYSTRHVVSALLRNCGYEVTAVADGLQAWKLLEEITNHVDLVISEVVMPCLSGIGLLSKIMSHKTRKNIPVIMMSCHDSMNVVFKCLSKGAVDFLVKPIRKNELKNLWRHVWQRCHSSSGSGSGSESGVQTQKSTKSKSAEDSDNQSGSNDEDDIGNIGLNARNGSDNGSGTQSCWTERAVEVGSPKPMSPWDDIAEPPDSTCAQVIHSWPEVISTNWVPTTATKGCDGQEDNFENNVTGKDLEIGRPGIPNMQLEGKSRTITIAANTEENFSERNTKDDDEQLDKGKLELNGEKPDRESRNQDADAMGVLTNSADPQSEGAIIDKSNNPSKAPNTKDKSVHENKELPSLELSLKRNRDDGDFETVNDRNILRHSAFSAFSRYNSASAATQALTGNVDSCSPFDNSSEVAKTESIQNLQSESNRTAPNQRSNGSSNNNDMGSTTNNAFGKPSATENELASKSTVKKTQAAERSSAFQSARNEHVSLPPMKTDAMNANSDAVNANSTSERPGCPNQQVQVQHHHHHYHHHHHHVHNIPKQQQLTNHGELKLKAAAPLCSSSNMETTQKVPDYSLNGNGSGSDQGSNGQNGSIRAINTKGDKLDNNDGVAGKGGITFGTGFGSRIGFDQNRVAQREMALNKFRQKRKERCFEKKVRYHSRKKLAEQRPRIRGQFVRKVQENKENDALS